MRKRLSKSKLTPHEFHYWSFMILTRTPRQQLMPYPMVQAEQFFNSDNSCQPVSFMSRAMTPTETGYKRIEKEGSTSISVDTDHKLLVPPLRTHTLDQLLPRTQRFRMRLMGFHFQEIKHVSGKNRCTQPMHFQGFRPETKQLSLQSYVKERA